MGAGNETKIWKFSSNCLNQWRAESALVQSKLIVTGSGITLLLKHLLPKVGRVSSIIVLCPLKVMYLCKRYYTGVYWSWILSLPLYYILLIAPNKIYNNYFHQLSSITVDREIFAVKIFSDSMASSKIKGAKIMRIINDSVVKACLSENYLTQKFIARNICNAKYSRITVLCIYM